MKHKIWIYVALAFIPLIIALKWMTLAYIIGHTISLAENAKQFTTLLYNVVNLPVMGAYEANAHITFAIILAIWWGLLLAHFIIYGPKKAIQDDGDVNKKDSPKGRDLLK